MLFSVDTHADPNSVVRKRKFDGAIRSEWQGMLMSAPTDEWLIVLHHPERHFKISNGTVEHAESWFLHCLNTRQPLMVLLEYDQHGWFQGAKCDAALPATLENADVGSLEEHLIEFVDLDLDVIVEDDLDCYVRDEMTFARNRTKMGYTAAVVQQAHAGIALAQKLLADRAFPFDARFVPKLTVLTLE